MTIEWAELQLDDAFDYSQVYVALSRITSLNGLWVRGGRITQSVVNANNGSTVLSQEFEIGKADMAHMKVEVLYQNNGSTVRSQD